MAIAICWTNCDHKPNTVRICCYVPEGKYVVECNINIKIFCLYVFNCFIEITRVIKTPWDLNVRGEKVTFSLVRKYVGTDLHVIKLLGNSIDILKGSAGWHLQLLSPISLLISYISERQHMCVYSDSKVFSYEFQTGKARVWIWILIILI